MQSLLVTDIVASTARAAAVGDRQWRGLVDEHDRVTGTLVERFQGELVKTMGDELIARFENADQALQAAGAMHAFMQGGRAGLAMKAGFTVVLAGRRAPGPRTATGAVRRSCRRVCAEVMSSTP